jgi:hypothetical protein
MNHATGTRDVLIPLRQWATDEREREGWNDSDRPTYRYRRMLLETAIDDLVRLRSVEAFLQEHQVNSDHEQALLLSEIQDLKRARREPAVSAQLNPFTLDQENEIRAWAEQYPSDSHARLFATLDLERERVSIAVEALKNMVGLGPKDDELRNEALRRVRGAK